MVCRFCEKRFEADGSENQVFCVYCGRENKNDSVEADVHTAEEEAMESATFELDPVRVRQRLLVLAKAYPESRALQGHLMLWNFRHNPVKDDYSDRFMALIGTILYFSKTEHLGSGRKKSLSEIHAFLEDPLLTSALAMFDRPSFRLYTEFHNAFLRSYTACRTEKNYGSNMLGLRRLKPDDIAIKSAVEYYEGCILYLAHLDGECCQEIIQASYNAYRAAFPEYRHYIRHQIDSARPLDRELILGLLGF